MFCHLGQHLHQIISLTFQEMCMFLSRVRQKVNTALTSVNRTSQAPVFSLQVTQQDTWDIVPRTV